VDNSSGVKGGFSFTNRTHTRTCAAVKTPAGHLAARHGGYFKLELMLKIVLGYRQKILLIKSLRDLI
jgi:hypothetical protein